MIMKRLAILVTFSLYCLNGFAQPDAIDKYLLAEPGKRSIPGLALALVVNSQVAALKTLGLASVELKVQVTPDSVFEIASLTRG